MSTSTFSPESAHPRPNLRNAWAFLSYPALTHPHVSEARSHLSHNPKADSESILAGWCSVLGLLQSRLCSGSLALLEIFGALQKL
jgi:hypothetical protein